MRLLLCVVALIAAWFAADRWFMVAQAATGGPHLAAIGNCDLPQPSEKAAMVFASYYDGASVSPVRLGEGEQGDTTSVVKLRIARGVGPLYVVIAGSRHSILDVSGWTKRVERLVVATDPHWPIAVTGLPLDRVRFVDRNSCGGSIPLDDVYRLAQSHQDLSPLSMVVRRPFPASMSDDERKKQKTEYRMPDAIGGAYEPQTMTISEWGVSAVEYKPHTHGDVPDWFDNSSEAADFHPGGLAKIALDGLVTPVPASIYKILPDRAGIAQLMRDGKVEGQYGGEYRILAPVELPEGLCGSMTARFTLAPGVPMRSEPSCQGHTSAPAVRF